MRTHMESGSCRIVPLFAAVLALVAMLAACASTPATTEAPAQVPAAPAPAPAKPVVPEGTTYVMHKVQYPGETVSIIAAWYLGDKMRFDVLAAANPGINPTLIKVGMTIRIPESMMKTRDPMPREFVDNFYGGPKGGRTPSPEPAKEDEPQLIGPKESPAK
jgi:hypothetical protein